jgi:hypothetical protein
LAKRDSFLIRVDPKLLEAVRKWSEDDLRSMNAQIEFLLTKALRDAGRLPSTKKKSEQTPSKIPTDKTSMDE